MARTPHDSPKGGSVEPEEGFFADPRKIAALHTRRADIRPRPYDDRPRLPPLAPRDTTSLAELLRQYISEAVPANDVPSERPSSGPSSSGPIPER